MSWAILEITDGTKAGTINLLGTGGGFLLADWRPAIQIPKSGGIWNGSPLTDGRRLALRNYENAIEVFNLTASRGSQDEIIRSMQNLFRLLDKAVNYWVTDWQTCPVYIKAKATNESNMRYALIMDYRIAGLNNPYGQPFFACPSIEDELTLTIERDYWTEQPPGTATAIEISAQQTYNGVTYGQEATTALESVFIANKHVMANITHAFHYDASLAAYSANLIGAALPIQFLPAAPATGDRIYFGCNTAVANSGPFSGVVFYISTGAVLVTDVDWYYLDGIGTETPLSVYTDLLGAGGGGAAFAGTGNKYVVFEPPSAWAPAPLNGITGYWIFGEITAGGGATPPRQNNRDFYSPVMPCVDIDSLQIPGDVPALSKMILTNYMGIAGLPAGTQDADIYAGIRTLERGSGFTPYINFGDDQNQAGITISAGTDVAIATYTAAPTGRSYRWQATTDAESVRVRIAIAQALRSTYKGRYIVILRCNAVDAGTTSVFLRIHYGTGYLFTLYESQQRTVETGYNELEFGVVNLPGTDANSDTLYISILGADEDSTNDIYFFDLILMPADEWLARYHAEWGTSTDGLRQNDFFVIDSVEDQKDYHTAILYSKEWVAGLPTSIKAPMSVNAVGQSIFQPNIDQRLWFFIRGSGARNFPIMSVSASRMSRYIAMRGDR